MTAFRMLNAKADKWPVESDELPAVAQPVAPSQPAPVVAAPANRSEVLGFSAAQEEAWKSILLDVMAIEQQRVDKLIAEIRADVRKGQEERKTLIDELRALKSCTAAWEKRWEIVWREYSDLHNALGMLLRFDSDSHKAIEKRYGSEWTQGLIDAIYRK